MKLNFLQFSWGDTEKGEMNVSTRGIAEDLLVELEFEMGFS